MSRRRCVLLPPCIAFIPTFLSLMSIFCIFEEFVDRYTNVKMAGLNYDFFCPRDTKRPPYYVNTRVYSCILLSNDVPYRWRGLFNEDTDLSLQVLKGGWCTMLTNQFLVGKAVGSKTRKRHGHFNVFSSNTTAMLRWRKS